MSQKRGFDGDKNAYTFLGFRVGDEVGGYVTPVQLHALNNLEFIV